MSYSFSAKGDTKQAALVDATEKFDAMVQQQPAHQRDRDVALATLRAQLDLVAEPEANQQITISLNGSISLTNPTAGPSVVQGVSVGCNVWVSIKPTEVPVPTSTI